MTDTNEPIYVAIFPHYWGRGPSVAEAMKEARCQGGSGRHYVVYRLPKGAIDPYCNEVNGALFWTWAEDTLPEERNADAEIVLDKSPGKTTSKTLAETEAAS